MTDDFKPLAVVVMSLTLMTLLAIVGTVILVLFYIGISYFVLIPLDSVTWGVIATLVYLFYFLYEVIHWDENPNTPVAFLFCTLLGGYEKLYFYIKKREPVLPNITQYKFGHILTCSLMSFGNRD